MLKIISCLSVSAALLLCLGTEETFAQTVKDPQSQSAPAEQAKGTEQAKAGEIAEAKYDADAALSEADKRIKARRAELDREAVSNARSMHFMLKSLIDKIEKNHPDLAASLKTQYLGIRLVQYLASLAILLFTFILTKYGLNFILKKLLYVSTKVMGESSFMSILAKQIKKPLNILAIIVGLYFAFVFLLRDSGNIVTLARGAGIAFWIAVFWCIVILSDTFFMTATKRLRKSSASTANLFEFIRRVSKAVIYTIAILSILTNCGVNVNTIIASLGIGGMALAFASQDTIANFFGSVSIIVDRPFIVGDYVKMGENRFAAKAIDDRAGCECLLRLTEKEFDVDFYAVFSDCEEIGGLGALAAAESIRPDIALVLEGTTCSDIPGTRETDTVTHLGGGAVIPVRDRSMTADRTLTALLKKTAEEENIPWQYKRTTAGGTDGGVIHLSSGGIRTAVLAIPVRYIHSAYSVADTRDLEAMCRLAEKFLERAGEEL